MITNVNFGILAILVICICGVSMTLPTNYCDRSRLCRKLAASWSSPLLTADVDDATSLLQLPDVKVFEHSVAEVQPQENSTDLGDLALYFFVALASWVLLQHYKCSRGRSKLPGKEHCEELLSIPGCKSCFEEDAALDVDASDCNLSTTLTCIEEVSNQKDTAPLQQAEEDTYNASKDIALMQKYASESNIAATLRTFRSIQQSGIGLTSSIYNIVLLAWSNCGNVQAAEDWMDEMLETGMADQNSFKILVKALVEARALRKARDRLNGMRKAGLEPCAAAFEELLSGFVREDSFAECLSLLEAMHRQGMQPTCITINIVTNLLNSSRRSGQSLSRIKEILRKYKLDSQEMSGAESMATAAAPLPHLAAVISQPAHKLEAPCAHEICISGSLSNVKAARRTLKQRGFLDKTESDAWPLDGHWETDHGLTVVMEGKMVRWSGARASRAHFIKQDRSACVLGLYGEAARGELLSAAGAPDAKKTLSWDNGDMWHSYDGRVIGQDTQFSQCMTKTLRDKTQDAAYQERSSAILKCLCRQALGVPAILEDTITQFLGNDLYYVRVRFASKWNPSHIEDEDELPSFEADADICDPISRRHPRVALRHCWAAPSMDLCGQRTLINGREVDESSFSKHIGVVRWA